MHRRAFFVACAALAAGACASPPGRSDCAARFAEGLRTLEPVSGGRLGVHVLDTASGAEYGYRADERFPMQSTFKLLASALVLARVDAGQEDLDRRIAFTRQDLVEWSPVTTQHAGNGTGLSLAELCAAALTASDNTAANLILASFGGPAALTAFARRIGDPATRLDRIEPDLNLAHPAGWDTTTPRAMAYSVRAVVLGDVLSAASRARLQGWLFANTTGDKRLKAGLPADWRIAEKTGSNRNSANDIGVLWPPGRAPMVVTSYLTDSAADGKTREATLAAVGRRVVELVACAG